MLWVEMGLKDGEGDRSPTRGAGTTLWAHWPKSGFGVELLGLPSCCGVWGFLCWLSQPQTAPSGCTSWFGLDPEGDRVLCAVLLRVKFRGEWEVEGKG